MQCAGHLTLNQLDLAPSAEWTVSPASWCILRLSAGVAYCFAGKTVLELPVGDTLVVRPGQSIVIRASQIGAAQLHYFHFQAERLIGLLTMTEQRRLAELAQAAGEAFQHPPAAHPAAARFSALCKARGRDGSLVERCRLLEVAALLFAPNLISHALPEALPTSALARFVELTQSAPEAEILGSSPAELALRCGCSARHFARLFHAHFGDSLRSRQTRLRLEKARQLLAETDAKVINVALDSGYRHLGLFNAMFKKHFGQTPTEFRRAKNKPARPVTGRASRLVLLLAGLLAAAPVQRAQAAEPAAPAATNAPVAVAATNAPVFLVRGYEIEGNTLLTEAQMHQALDSHTATNATFETIRAALGDLQLAYRARGYVTVSVTLPRQQLTNGIVRALVTEGRLARIEVVGNRHYSTKNILATLPSLRTNILLNSLVLQQELDRANQNRDRQIYPEIGPGPEPGTSSLKLKIKDRLPLHARVEVNNFATPGTPELRVNTAAQYNNLWQLDHSLGVQYSMSPQEFKGPESHPDFYDTPLIASYSAFYRLELNELGGAPERRDVGIQDFGYDEATKRFRPPLLGGHAEMVFYASRSFSDTGVKSLPDSSLTTSSGTNSSSQTLNVVTKTTQQTLSVNENMGFRVTDPLSAVWGILPTLSAGFDYKIFRSLANQTTTAQGSLNVPGSPPIVIPSPPPAVRASESFVQYLPFTAGLNATRPDKWGSTSLNLNNTYNPAALLGNGDEFRQTTGSQKADGNYYIAAMGLSREQKLIGDWALRLSADGQWASQPLITSEQFAMGGNAGVRGYRDGQQYGDAGWRVMIEPHSSLYDMSSEDGLTTVLLRFSAFTDYGRTYLLAPGAGAQDSVSMWGVGVGFSMSVGQYFDGRVTLAVPLLRNAAFPTGSARIAFAASWQF